MAEKTFPLTKDQVERLAERHPTPFHLYDESGMRANARLFKQAFSECPGFMNYFAVKAAPNPFLLKIMKSEGFGVDCSSLPELLLAERAGFRGEEIIFTSNDTPAEEFVAARRLGAIINLDDITHLSFLEEHAGLPSLLCMRYNPGPLKSGNAIIGHPEEAKYGFTREQLFEGYRQARDKGVKRFGIHTMVASNELNADYFVETAELLFDLVAELSQQLDITFDFVNLGGGIGIPYHPEDDPVDLAAVGRGVASAYRERVIGRSHPPLRVCMECGRMIAGPYGWLVSRIRHIKNTYKRFAGLDACMADLMRPAIYGAYHHITVPGKETVPAELLYDVTGSLCENNDKFAIDRPLPKLERGDFIVIHDAGAHGHAMGFNYNGKLRSAELLRRADGTIMEIRRAETVEDLFATLDFAAFDPFEP